MQHSAVNNPLFNVHSDIRASCATNPSPTRDIPPPPQQQDGKGSKPARAHRICCCWRAVPWLPVLCTVLTIGALIVWTVHTDRVVAALLSVLGRIQAPPAVPDGIASAVGTLKTVVVAEVSAVVGLLLLLATYRQHQNLKKRKALTYADWPHGWRTYCFMGATVFSMVALWLTIAALVCLLCLATATTGVALAGSVSAGKAASNGAANSTTVSSATASAVCAPSCLDLSPIANLLPGADTAAEGACICAQQSLQELHQQLTGMWRDGLAACAALAALLAAASWLLVHGVANYVGAQRDHQDALYFQQEHQQANQREHRIRNWMRSSPSPTAVGASFDVKADQQRQTQLLAPELRASLSPKKGHGGGNEDWPAAGDVHMPVDVEQPTLHSDQLPSATPLASSIAGYTDTLRSSASSNMQQQSRRRWNDSLRR